MIARRILLLILVAISGGCAVTQWQREQDAIAAMARDVEALHSPEIEDAIRAAKPIEVALERRT